MTGPSREALASARRSARALGERQLHPEHLLLGLASQRGPVADALHGCGITPATVVSALRPVGS